MLKENFERLSLMSLQKLLFMKKRMPLKKKNLKKIAAKMENQSLTDGSWKEKARISPRT